MPVQSRMPVTAAAAEALGELASRAAALAAAAGGNLLECFAAIPDPRDARGIRHSLPCVLALCTAAVLCGNTAIEDVTAWVHAAPQAVLAAAGARQNALGARVAPHPETVVRIFTALGAHGVARHAGAYLARRAHPGPAAFPLAGPGWLPAVAVDGKAVRGAAGPDGLIPYLLAAAVHGTGAVLAERLIGPKTNEVPELAPLLRELNGYYPLAGHVITADAGHTVRAHATFICGELLAHYVLTVKRNTPALWDELDALDWASVPVRHVTEEKGHGRRERRTIQVMDAPAHISGRFPHARQAALIERYVTRTVRVRKGKRWVRKQVKTAVAVFIITSLDAREAAPEHIAGYVRRHWTIENKVHYVRSPGVPSPLHDVAVKRFTESFCNTSARCGARCRRCSEPCRRGPATCATPLTIVGDELTPLRPARSAGTRAMPVLHPEGTSAMLLTVRTRPGSGPAQGPA